MKTGDRLQLSNEGRRMWHLFPNPQVLGTIRPPRRLPRRHLRPRPHRRPETPQDLRYPVLAPGNEYHGEPMRPATEIQKMAPGRKMEALIAALMGDWLEDGWWMSKDGSKYIHEDRGPKPYSSSIKDAFEVVDRMSTDGYGLVLEDWRNEGEPAGKWMAYFNTPAGGTSDQQCGSSAPEAICKAALILSIRNLPAKHPG